jgi:hypothetical protein
MTGFILDILNADLPDLLGDLYVPCVAAVATCWAILSLAGSIGIFQHLLTCFLGGSKK